jgi:hypothetical protein
MVSDQIGIIMSSSTMHLRCHDEQFWIDGTLFTRAASSNADSTKQFPTNNPGLGEWAEVKSLANISLALALACSSCKSRVQPAPEKIAGWTAKLRDAQPEDAFAAIYSRSRKKLLFIGAKHANDTGSLTFRMIADAYASFRVNTLIVEGSLYSRGANPQRLLDWVRHQTERNGFVEGGETVPAVQGARKQGANVWGGEPDDSVIRDRAIAEGFSVRDLLGFYTLRSVPQWIRERKIIGPDDPGVKKLIDQELQKNRLRLGLSEPVLPDYAAWAKWYACTNQKPFGSAFDPEETGPLADGPYASNKLAAAISRSRDAFLLEIIAQHLNAGETVMVVSGESHLMLLRPALDHMLGPPCYVGNALRSAPFACTD